MNSRAQQLLVAAGVVLSASLTISEAAFAQTSIYSSGATLPSLGYRAWADCYGVNLGFTSANEATAPRPLGCNFASVTSFRYYYAAIGSGGGRSNFLQNTSTNGTPSAPPDFTDSFTTSYPYPRTDWSGSDVALTVTEQGSYDANRRPTRGRNIQVPTLLSAIAMPFNLPNGSNTAPRTSLRLRRSTYCGIWSGAITRWDDPAITTDNNGSIVTNSNRAAFPGGVPTITLSVRSDNSGTTNDFALHLNTVCPGVGFTIPFSGGGSPLAALQAAGATVVSGNGSNGVVDNVSAIVGGLGYASPSFTAPTVPGGLPTASLQNGFNFTNGNAGVYTAPTTSATSNAAVGFLPTDTNGNGILDPAEFGALTTFVSNPNASNAYPIIAPTYANIYCTGYPNNNVRNGVRNLFNWAYTNNNADSVLSSLALAAIPDNSNTASDPDSLSELSAAAVNSLGTTTGSCSP